MSDHAKLSPSAAERWMTCPGSVVLSEGMPQRTSEFAEEGTRAHAMAEKILKGEAVQTDDIEMWEFVAEYTAHVFSLTDDAANTTLHVEQRIEVTDDLWGTADAIVWNPATRVLAVRDLKYGAGVAVEVRDNLQLKIYALGALLTMGYPAETVDVGIVQPRCFHSAGAVRTVQFDVVDLVDFHADVMEAVYRVKTAQQHLDLDAHVVPSEKGCRWCLAAPKCPALKAKAQALAKITFAPGLPYDPQQLADSLEFLDILEGWIKNTREFAYSEAEKGHAIPNHKLVEKVARRKWKSEDAVLPALRGVLAEDVIFEKKLITPAAAEKLLAKDQRAMLADLTTKESSGHALVHVSDKREAVRVDAKSAFA